MWHNTYSARRTRQQLCRWRYMSARGELPTVLYLEYLCGWDAGSLGSTSRAERQGCVPNRIFQRHRLPRSGGRSGRRSDQQPTASRRGHLDKHSSPRFPSIGLTYQIVSSAEPSIYCPSGSPTRPDGSGDFTDREIGLSDNPVVGATRWVGQQLSRLPYLLSCRRHL